LHIIFLILIYPVYTKNFSKAKVSVLKFPSLAIRLGRRGVDKLRWTGWRGWMGYFCPPLGEVARRRLKVWERGRENGSFPVEEGWETERFHRSKSHLRRRRRTGANLICDGGVRTYYCPSVPRWRVWHEVAGCGLPLPSPFTIKSIPKIPKA